MYSTNGECKCILSGMPLAHLEFVVKEGMQYEKSLVFSGGTTSKPGSNFLTCDFATHFSDSKTGFMSGNPRNIVP